MKVGIVVPFSWSFWGGVVDHADNQARVLHQLGVDARILVGNDPPGRLTKFLHPRSGRHERPPDYVIPIGRTVIVPANSSLSNVVLSPSAMIRMRDVLRDQNFDVLHVHEPFAPILSALALVLAECPTVVTCHASGGRFYPMGRALWGRLIRESLDYRIAVSNQAKLAALPHVQGRFEIIPNGVMLGEEPDFSDRENVVLFVGRHEPRKGLHVLLNAWPEIAAQSGARLRVVGADPLAVRFLMRRLGVSEDSIELLGVVPRDELVRQLSLAKVLVAPSLGGESFGLVIVEAFAAGVPVVASEIPGYDEVINSKTGVLFPPGDQGALIAATVGLLVDEARRQTLGKLARKRVVDCYDWLLIGKRLLEIYKSLTGIQVENR